MYLHHSLLGYLQNILIVFLFLYDYLLVQMYSTVIVSILYGTYRFINLIDQNIVHRHNAEEMKRYIHFNEYVHCLQR